MIEIQMDFNTFIGYVALKYKLELIYFTSIEEQVQTT